MSLSSPWATIATGKIYKMKTTLRSHHSTFEVTIIKTLIVLVVCVGVAIAGIMRDEKSKKFYSVNNLECYNLSPCSKSTSSKFGN